MRSRQCLLTVNKHVHDFMNDDRLGDDDYARIARYLAEELSPVDRAETERWLSEDQDRRSAVESMRAGWAAARSPRVWNVDQGWSRLSARLADGIEVVPPRAARDVIPLAPRRRWWHNSTRLMQVAAASVAIAGTAVLWPTLRSRLDGDSGPVAASNGVVRVATKAGERRTFDLPDGSRVILGFSSTLVSREGYGGSTREVDLDGEAYFTVTHDAARPFRVHVGSTVIEDLGTEFAVRAYESAGSVRVAVAVGSVSLRRGTSPAPSVVLSPRDVAFLDDTGEVRLTRGVDLSTYTAWTGGRLVFDDTPLAQVAEELERWYGVEVRVTDSALLSRHLTTAFESETLDEVLRVIGMSLDVRYVRKGNVVEFTGSGASTGQLKPPAARLETGA